MHLIRTRETLLNLETGAGYLTEKKGDDQQGFVAGRVAVTVEQIINEHVLAWATAEYLPKISDVSVFLVNSETGIATALARGFSLNVTLQTRYDSAPVEAKHSTDTVLTTSLSLNF